MYTHIYTHTRRERNIHIWASLEAQTVRICLQYRRPGFDPQVGKIPWRRAWQPTPVFLPGESPWAEEPGGLQSVGLQRVRQDWATKQSTYSHMCRNRYVYICMYVCVCLWCVWSVFVLYEFLIFYSVVCRKGGIYSVWGKCRAFYDPSRKCYKMNA